MALPSHNAIMSPTSTDLDTKPGETLTRVTSNSRARSSTQGSLSRVSTRDSTTSSSGDPSNRGLSGFLASAKSFFTGHETAQPEPIQSSRTNASRSGSVSNGSVPASARLKSDSVSSDNAPIPSGASAIAMRPQPSRDGSGGSGMTRTVSRNIQTGQIVLPANDMATHSPSIADAQLPGDSVSETTIPDASDPPAQAATRPAAIPSDGSANSLFSSVSAGSASTAATTPSISPVGRQLDGAPSPITPGMSRPLLTPGGSRALGTPQAVQLRLRTLPRLASYTMQKPLSEVASGKARARDPIEAATQERSYAYDSATSQSGTDTAADDDTETDDDEDEDDEDVDHNEDHVGRGEAAMQRGFQRPVLPTLASTRGFPKLAQSVRTPGQTPAARTPGPSQFAGWTTFQTSTPTPGGMRTARPTATDNTPNGSYFDVRPQGGRTPVQTPRADAGSSVRGTPGSQQNRIPQTPGARMYPVQTQNPMSSPVARIRVDTAVARGILTTPGLNARPSYVGSMGSTASSPISSASPAAYANVLRDASPPTGVSPTSTLFPANSLTGAVTSPEAPSLESVLASAAPAGPMPAGMTSRPSFRSRQSRSAVDLRSSYRAAEGTGSTGPSPRQSMDDQSYAEPPSVEPTAQQRETEGSQALPASSTSSQTQPGLQRRVSMPEMRVDPPSYQLDDDFVVVYNSAQLPVSREEEGKEALPSYTCDVHIEAWVPRKMEFMKPGEQAKDRRWKRQYMILHGTSIKIYKSDPRSKAVLGADAPPTPGIHKDMSKPILGLAPMASRASTSSEASGARSRRGTTSSVVSTSSSTSSLTSTTSEKSANYVPNSTMSVADQRTFDPDVPVHVHIHGDEDSVRANLQHPSALIAKAGDNRIVRHYTLQGAESGLAADYLKRPHVVRIRAEGEQFLIQARDDRAVIDWIEALQAATNTALDLDVRPLPKFITLPRRRRRRARPADPATATTTAGAGTTFGGATGQSTPTRDQTRARSDAMNNMLADEQADYDRQRGGLVS